MESVGGKSHEFEGVDHTASLERVLLVHQARDACEIDLEELRGLAEACGGTVVGTLLSHRRTPVAGTFLGRGKVDELAGLTEEHKVDLVVFNQELSPIQERNLERAVKTRVVDRTRLILDIFALRAKTAEGKLQVELAQLRHLATRLVRGWTHLERQKGGIGLRGPGETQLETDRRLIGHRIRALKQKLAKVESQRKLRRRGRERTPVPTVSLVGYTNAGKSTLFNRLTHANVFARDLLFATLDPTMRKYQLPSGENIVLSDTVGFISQLPHGLIKAFHSTLEEIRGSTLLLHVIDVSDPQNIERIQDVNDVLKEIDADGIPVVEVFNKIDRVNQSPTARTDEPDGTARVFLSATTGDGVDLLDNVLDAFFSRDRETRTIRLPPHAARMRARLHDRCRILKETFTDCGEVELEVDVDRADRGWIEGQADFRPEYWV